MTDLITVSLGLLFQNTRTRFCDRLEWDLTYAGVSREGYLAEAIENGVDDMAERPFYRLYAIFVQHQKDGDEVSTCIWDVARGWHPFADKCMRP